MRAVVQERRGERVTVRVTEAPRPEPERDQALVRMTAAAVSRHDVGPLRVAREEACRIPGAEGAGIIEVSGGTGLARGTRVMVSPGRSVRGPAQAGAWAEYVAVAPADVVPIPPGVTDAQAAGFLVPYTVAQLALSFAGCFQRGQSVLVPGVGGAVGNAAVQLARAQGAERVITTAGCSEKAVCARAAGYADVIDLSEEMLITTVMQLTGDAGVDLAIDSVGGFLTGSSLSALGRGGTLVVVGSPAGAWVEVLLTDLISRSARMTGLDLANVPEGRIRHATGIIVSLLAERRVTPLVARAFPLAQAAEAGQYLIEEQPFGRVVLAL